MKGELTTSQASFSLEEVLEAISLNEDQEQQLRAEIETLFSEVIYLLPRGPVDAVTLETGQICLAEDFLCVPLDRKTAALVTGFLLISEVFQLKKNQHQRALNNWNKIRVIDIQDGKWRENGVLLKAIYFHNVQFSIFDIIEDPDLLRVYANLDELDYDSSLNSVVAADKRSRKNIHVLTRLRGFGNR